MTIGLPKNVSPRDVEIIEEVCNHHTNKNIGVILGIKEHTVGCALTVIYKKCSVKTRKELIAKYKGVA